MNKVSVAGEYRIEVKGQDGKVRFESDWFDNLILNQGLNRLGPAGVKFNRAMVGTGTLAPAETQTQLQAQIGVSATSSLSTSRTNSGAPLYETQHLFTFVFAQGAVVGNISEIGVGWDTTNCFSRALILDALGNPISITITAIDQLTVFYRLTVRPVLTDTSGSVVISGITYPYTARVANVASFCDQNDVFSGTAADGVSFSTGPGAGNTSYMSVRGPGAVLGPITATATGGSLATVGFTPSYPAYSTDTFYRDTTISWAIAQGNVSGGVQTIAMYWSDTGSSYQWYFPTPLPKDNTKTMSLTFRFSWARL